jgi:hypothetical protein
MNYEVEMVCIMFIPNFVHNSELVQNLRRGYTHRYHSHLKRLPQPNKINQVIYVLHPYKFHNCNLLNRNILITVILTSNTTVYYWTIKMEWPQLVFLFWW